jgi:hypothetical protein
MKVIYFSPHAGSFFQSYPEALIMDSLQKNGADVIYISCGKILGGVCVNKIAHGITEKSSLITHHRICNNCVASARLISDGFDFKNESLLNYINESDINFVEDFVSLNSNKLPDEIFYKNINVGNISLYQLILRFKLLSIQFDEEKKNIYFSELRNTILSAIAFEKIVLKHKPDILMVNNGLYNINKVALEIAEKHGITGYFNQAGNYLPRRIHNIMIGRGNYYDFYASIIENWSNFDKFTPAKSDLKKITLHVKKLFDAKNIFVYSAKKNKNTKNLRTYFGVPPASKLLVATMSSYDEEIAAQLVGGRKIKNKPLFEKQEEWIKFIIEHVKNRDDLFLIIRPHPREFPNRREQRLSEHAKFIQDLVLASNKNIVVNVPADNISLYDFIPYTDVFLNAWSSAGKELSLFGAPVVNFQTDLMPYPSDLNYVLSNKDEFSLLLNDAICKGWNGQFVIQTYKWYVIEYVKSLVNISSNCKLSESEDLNYLYRFILKFEKFFFNNPYFFKWLIIKLTPKNNEYKYIFEMLNDRTKTPLEYHNSTFFHNNQIVDDVKDEFYELLSLFSKEESELIRTKVKWI